MSNSQIAKDTAKTEDKYRGLIVSLVVLFASLIIIMIVNYVLAQRNTTASEHMDLIGDISDGTLHIATAAQHLALMDPMDKTAMKATMDEIATYASKIDSNMEELKNYKTKETAMQEFGVIWQEYHQKIDRASSLSFADTLELARYANAQKAPIWDLMNEGFDVYLEEGYALSSYSRYLQVATLLGLLSYLLFFARFTFRRMRQTDEQLLVAHRQTDDIMKTINEGLFLIDDKLVVADKYSDKLESIIQQKNLAGRSLYDILRGMISQKDMETLKLFVEQLYNTWVVEDLIHDLNPLRQVLVSYVDDNEVAHTKFLKFNFLRVLDSDSETIKNVFVSVTDITNEVRLQNQLDKDKEQHNRQIETIAYLLTVDGKQMQNFIGETKQRIERMNDVLKTRNTGNLQEKVQQLYRDTHSLKGDASAMKLGAVVDIATQQEDLLKNLSENKELKGNDFLPFTVALDELINTVSFIENLTERLRLGDGIAPLQASLHTQSTHDTTKADATADHAQASTSEIVNELSQSLNNHWVGYFEQYAQDIAERHHKKVKTVVHGFEVLDDNEDIRSMCKDITTQLLKNAIVHGIEAPEQRLIQGKDETGVVSLSLTDTKNGHYKLHIRDDGQGINWEKIRQSVVKQGRMNEGQARELSRRDLLKYMFSSGISTAEHTDEDAGRGVGMDIVRQLTLDLEGKISVSSQEYQFTDVSIVFPNPNA